MHGDSIRIAMHLFFIRRSAQNEEYLIVNNEKKLMSCTYSTYWNCNQRWWRAFGSCWFATLRRSTDGS